MNLQPVSLEAYEEKQKVAETLAPAATEKFNCSCCGNDFPTRGSLHKHQRGNQTISAPLISSPEEACLFCNSPSASLQENITHMLLKHGFFIPDLELVKDLSGLVQYLQKKVRELLLCLHCNNRGHNFRSVQAVQQHMVDKQHCFLNTEEDEKEFRQFYGADSSFEIISSDHEINIDHYVDLGSHSEDISSFSVIGSSTHNEAFEVESTGELRLANGKILGNKQFWRYYQQVYRPRPRRIQNLLGIVGEEHEHRQSCEELEEKDRGGRAWEVERDRLLKQGMKNNMLQPHMRKQIN